MEVKGVGLDKKNNPNVSTLQKYNITIRVFKASYPTDSPQEEENYTQSNDQNKNERQDHETCIWRNSSG